MNHVAYGRRKTAPVRGHEGLVVVEHRDDNAVIYIDGVFRAFMEVVARYQDSLQGGVTSNGIRETFEAMFDKYGRIGVGSDVLG